MDIQKNRSCFVFFILVPLVLSGCGSFDFFKKSAASPPDTAGQIETEPSQAEPGLIKPILTESAGQDTEPEPVLIAENKADLDQLVKEKNSRIQELQARIKQLEKKVTALEKAQLSAKKINFKFDYSSPAQLYKKARNLLLEEDYINAGMLFKKFISAHPKHSLADNAAYWLAECHYSMAEYEKAIQIFKDIETRYPKSEKVPDAILKTGYSYLSLDDTNRANHFLKKVLKKYPFSPAAEKAQEKLNQFE